MGVLKSSTPTSSVLKALRVSLGSQGVSWIAEFLELGGLEPLLQSLESVDYRQYVFFSLAFCTVVYDVISFSMTDESAAIQTECVYALKALMNTHVGLTV